MFSGAGASIETHLTTTGLLDLKEKRAGGFGIGKLPVLSASATEVRFGNSALEQAAGTQRIEGSFDPASGDMKIVVRSEKRPSEISIRMELSCRTMPPVS